MVLASSYPEPPVRRLRIYSFDPALAARHDLAGTSIVTIEIPWESGLNPGPVGEYIEVVDVDPGSAAAYAPVDLNDPVLLATDGLAPSESDPRFHQQMVYAVAMKTIEHFERALGRKALWSAHRVDTSEGKPKQQYVPRLRIYPHALREANAYYSPQKQALLFGYFASRLRDRNNTPGTFTFTCLSHDIIAHETTHALLDGVHPRFNEPVNEDVLAFHEAFADIVALFQHFSYPGVLRDQIARTRGNLSRESQLGQLAQQFALASGRGDALRSYLGRKDADGVWKASQPSASLLAETLEPHDRGAILVAAVFGAFMKVFQARSRDLFRIASDGTGVLREGDIHPDLVNRLAEEARRCAERALQMCIRAIDYCPPVGITFGAYLRSVITADSDLNPSDPDSWRLAFIESFRSWGIAPDGIRSMAEDSLLWPTEEDVLAQRVREESQRAPATSEEVYTQRAATNARDAMSSAFRPSLTKRSPSAEAMPRSTRQEEQDTGQVLTPVPHWLSRRDTAFEARTQAYRFHDWLLEESARWLADTLGLVTSLMGQPCTISARNDGSMTANAEVHSVRTAMKQGNLGWPVQHMVVVVTQWRAGYLDRGKQTEFDQRADALNSDVQKRNPLDFKYRAGCTLLIDPQQTRIVRAIKTRGTVSDDGELDRMRRYVSAGLMPANAFAGPQSRFGIRNEPFAFLHSHAGG